MPAAIRWSEEMDATMRVMRADGASWEEIATRVGVEVKTAMRRARVLGLATGHLSIGPVSGRAIKAGARPPRYPRSTKWQEMTL